MTRTADAVLRYTLLFAFLAISIAGLVLFAGCSADYIREHEVPGTKGGIITDLPKYCKQVPTDSACQRDK